MLNLLPTWVWALVPTAMFAFVLWRQRAPHAVAQPRAGDPLHALQAEMLRGLLRKEGLLPPEPARPPLDEPAIFACPQRFKVIPMSRQEGAADA